jgi:tetratricopeptide (TPR) repeat protein/tRNA A-37 threonylcarbamoyl transferase component Bud32
MNEEKINLNFNNINSSPNDSTQIVECNAGKKQLIADRYEIIKEVGKGGMGIVYKAMDNRLKRVIAIKTLKYDKQAITDNTELQMMLLEAQATARLNHQNIVSVFDVVIDNTPPYIAMEYIEGNTLSKLILTKNIGDLNEIIDMMIQICDGIDHAHDKGIIHRDLKPQNIMITDKKIKITDFGIARILGMEEKTKEPKRVMGTPSYMAPERLLGHKADHRSDIFSIGVIMYELLTGVKPFHGDSFTDIMTKILYHNFVPINEIVPKIPDILCKVVAKSLVKEPRNRFQKASLIKESLEEFRISTPDRMSQKFDDLVERPLIWNIPHHRNTNFTGREEIFHKIHEELTSQKPGSKVIALHGLGGIGKTQLVLEYVYRYGIDARNYKIIWWIRADMLTSLSADYAALTVPLKLSNENLKESDIVKIVRNWLEQNEGWLLIFDNAEDPSEIGNDYLPKSRKGHVIITSRNPNWRGIAATLPMSNLKIEESIELLGKWTGDVDREKMTELSTILGNLPLALSQAGAYITETGSSINDYLELFKEHETELLKTGIESSIHDTPVAATWELSFDKIQKESPAAVELMNLCAFLAPDDIPLNIFREGKESLPETLRDIVTDRLKFDKAIAAILRYSMANRKSDAISVHKLVQTVVKDKLTDEENQIYIKSVIRLLMSLFPQEVDKVDKLMDCSRILPHAIVAIKHAKAHEVVEEICSSLSRNIGIYFNLIGKYEETKTAYEDALTIDEKLFGPEHQIIAKYANNLGNTLRLLGNFTGAKMYLKRAFAIEEKLFGPECPGLANIFNNLGLVFRDLGDLESSLMNFEKALEIDEKIYGPDHANVARDAGNLGSIFRLLGNFEKAKANSERALEIDMKLFGSDHPNVARDANNLGTVLRDLGDLDGAKTYFKSAIKIVEKSFGSDHPMLATISFNLGNVLLDSGDLAEAKVNSEKALAIREKYFGPEHHAVASSLESISEILKRLGELNEAKKITERALNISEKNFGSEHPSVVENIYNLAMILHAIGATKTSREYLERAIEMGEKIFGFSHFNVGKYLRDYGDNIRDQGETKKAKESYQRALDIYAKTFGGNHPKTLEVKKKLDELHAKIDNQESN